MGKIKDDQWVGDYFKRLSIAFNDDEAKIKLGDLKNLILETRDNGNKIILVGNGASNTIATHGAIDFSNQLGIPSFSINDGGFLTAGANDFGYDNIFERAADIFLKEGDLLICISSSGSSPNVRNAAKRGKELGCKVATFSGFKPDNPLRSLGDVNFYVDNNEYNIVESIHNAWLVCISDMIIKDNPETVGVHGLEFGLKGKVYND